jgi:hypothetical protein
MVQTVVQEMVCRVVVQSPTARKPLRMAEKMALEASSEGGGTHRDVKWRRKRADTSWRPPPGGPQAASR